MKKTAGRSRFTAIETLYRLQKSHTFVSRIIDRVASENDLNSQDRHLVMNICYGVLRNRDYLDYLMTRLCRQPVRKMKPFIYHALSVGLYQLFCLDRIPASAAVNETVNGVKMARLSRPLQGFVNGVLRESLRQRNHLPAPDGVDDTGKPFLNHPQWLTNRWLRRFGRKTMQAVCLANNREPVLCLRLARGISVDHYRHILKTAGIDSLPGEYAPDSVILSHFHGAITEVPGFRKGLFQVQDQSAQLAVGLLGPFRERERILDCCAGVGGKTILASVLSAENSRIIALEPSRLRFRQLQENIERMGEQKRIVVYNTALQDFFRSSRLLFDKILVDAPCSGTGVVGRQPDIRWNRKENDLVVNQTRQLQILEAAAARVRPGGCIVYATCSLEEEENEMVINTFIARNQAFQLTDAKTYLPTEAHCLMRGPYFFPLPSQQVDGFFAARLVRVS